MRTISLLSLVLIALLTASTSLAVPSGKVLQYQKSPNGTVTFDGTSHQKASLGCKDCHKEGVFPQKKFGGVKITMKEIFSGKRFFAHAKLLPHRRRFSREDFFD